MLNNTLQIYRNGEEHVLINIDKQTRFSHQIMGEHLVRSTITIDTALDISEGDYIIFRGEQFTLNRPQPPIDKQSNSKYIYDFEFEGYVYDLRDMPFMHLGALEFSIFIKPLGLVQMVVACMNEISVGWAVGAVDDLPEQLMDFYADGKGHTCKEALIKGVDIFKLEFWLTGKTINFTKKAGVDTSLVFKYGKNNGLYSITRLSNDDVPYFNRLIIQGGTKNIPYTYRGGAKRLRLEEPYLEIPLTGGKKRRVSSVVLDEVYPQRTGTVTAVSDDFLNITDSSIDFDLNGLKIEGTTPTIEFITGSNAGQIFEINSYDHATKKINILPITQADGKTLPSPVFSIEVGHKYKFIGIIMPAPYFTSAENDLRTKGLEILARASSVIPPYRIIADPKFIRDNGTVVNAGDRVRIVDDPIGVDASIRVTGVGFPLVAHDEIDLDVSDIVVLRPSDKAIIDIKKNEQKVVTTTKVTYENARQASKSLNKLTERVFDPDGSLAGGPATLRAAMGIFGFDSSNFGLVGVTTTTNVGGDPNKLSISAGLLVHNIYEIEGLGFTWAMTAANFVGLNPLKFYYVYAKCSKTSLVGTWEISDTRVTVNQFEGFWVFNSGQLSEVNGDNWRPFNFTKGVTWIVGNQIFTGRVQDVTKQNYFDLDTGQFKLGNLVYGIDWSVTKAGRLTIRGGIAVSPGGTIDYVPVFRGDYNPLTPYYLGDTVKWTDGNVYKWISEVVEGTTGTPPPDPDYWRLTTEKGDAGVDGKYTEIRYRKNGSPTAPPAIDHTNSNPASWTTIMPTIATLEYLWISTAVKNADGSLVTNWATPARINGIDGVNGIDGNDGTTGAFIAPRGNYDPLEEYTGTLELVNAVYYLGDYYVSRIDAGVFSGQLPTNAAYWTPVDAQFKMVATDLFLADIAYIHNLGAGRIRTASTGKRTEINRNSSNSFEQFDDSNVRIVHIDDDAAVESDDTFNSYSALYDEFGNPTWLYSRIVGIDTQYTYAYKDVGIAIGYGQQHADGYTTIGRKRIRTTGEIVASTADTNTQTRMTPSGMVISGALGEGLLTGYTGEVLVLGGTARVVGGIIVN